MAQSDILRQQTAAGVRTAEIDAGLRAHMNKIYGLMSVGLAVTGAVAWAFGTSEALFSILRDPVTLQPNLLGWAVMFAPLAFVLVMSFGINRLSAGAAQALFYVFAAVMGMSISWIFMAFTGMSIAQTFFVTAIAFAGLSLWGYTTKRDLSGMGAFLLMGLIGIIVASIVNIFILSSALGFAISVIGVLIFAGLTAYDTQRLKNEYLMAVGQPGGAAWLEKSAILGALSLYLNFINLFMFLLQFLGNRE